jgi:flagellar hook-length control protein FliK
LIGWLFDSFAAAGEVVTDQDAVTTMPDMRLPTPAAVRIDARLQSAFVDGAEVMPRDPEPLPSPSSSLPSLAAPLFAPELPSEPLPPATFAASLSSPLVAQHAAVAATSVASSTSPAPPLVLHADGPDLSADLGERISWQLQQGLGEATIELHPAELGALTIRIETQAQQAQVHILAAEPAARALISQCLPQLRELLGASGLTLTRGQVESAERRGGQLGTGSDGLLSPRGARRRVTSVTLVDTYA